MAITREQLMAYADGQLPAEQVAEVEAALATSEADRALVAGYRKTALAAREAFDEVLREPIPDRLLAPFAAARQGDVVRPPFRRRTGPVLALAASVLLAAGVGFALVWQGASWTNDGLHKANRAAQASPDGVQASGALARALDTSGSGQESLSPSGERIVLVSTYPQKGGGWCRDYRVSGPGPNATAGVACRGADATGWQIAVHAPASPPVGEQGQVVKPSGPAPEGMPDVVDAVAEQRQHGTPLTANQEAELIARGWRAP